MKSYGAILGLWAWASSSVWGASAFVPLSRLHAFKSLQASSYLGDLSGEPSQPAVSTTAPAAPIPESPLDSALEKAAAPAEAAPTPVDFWDLATKVKVQGGSLRTWSFSTPDVEAVQVRLKTAGRPLNANVDLWQGPDNTPQKMGIYIEDAKLRPFNAVIATPRGQNTVAIRNTAQMEFPLDASVEADIKDGQETAIALSGVISMLDETSAPETVQGGAIKTYSFAPSVSSVQILLKTDGRPLNARIELLQGPNNNKQVMEVYTEDGLERPFFAVVEAPGSGNVVRIQNTSPLEFPMSARCEPFMINSNMDGSVLIDGGSIREVSLGRRFF